MQGWDAVRLALNPFTLAQRRKVPPGQGRGRQIVFAVDSSSFCENAVRFGLDNVTRANDSVSFACVYKKANLHPPDVGSYVDGVPIRSDRDEHIRKQAELLDKKRCETACGRFVDDARAMGVQGVSMEVLPAGASAGGGTIIDVLEHYVKSTCADLVVVGSRGVGALHGSFLGLMGLGSVSEGLVKQLKVPLLIVKHEATSKRDDNPEKLSSSAKATQRKTAAEHDDDIPAEGGFTKG